MVEHLQISRITAVRHLHKLGYDGKAARRRPLLKSLNIERRKQRASEKLERPLSFGNESSFLMSPPSPNFHAADECRSRDYPARNSRGTGCSQFSSEVDFQSLMVWGATLEHRTFGAWVEHQLRKIYCHFWRKVFYQSSRCNVFKRTRLSL